MNESHENRMSIGGFSIPMAEDASMDRRQFGTSLLGQLRNAWRRTPPLQAEPAAQQPASRPARRPVPAPQPALPPETAAADAAKPLERSRVVFAEELVPGSVVLEPCSGTSCSNGTTHQRGSFHELTILRLRGRSFITAVTVDEDGNQQGFETGRSRTVRVRFE